MKSEKRRLIGARIRSLREDKGFSQDVLAEKLSMKRANVANYESGRALPPAEVLLKLANIFSVSTDYLLGRDIEDDPSGFAEIGWIVKEERNVQGLSQKELAEIIGISQNEVSKIERNLIDIPPETAEKIAQAFGMSLPAFLDKYNMWNGYVNPEFDGDVDKQIEFEKALEEDHQKELEQEWVRQEEEKIITLAAHQVGHDGPLTEEQLAQIKLAMKIALAKNDK